MMKWLFAVCALALVGTASHVFAGDDANSATDKLFVQGAASGGMLEVQLGQYAAQNATGGDVRSFAQQMVDDHSKANDGLKKAAALQQIEVPAALTPDDQKTLDRLESLKGDDFDKAYVKQMVDDHQKTVAAFEQESKQTAGPLRDFADQTLPILRHHLEMAQDLSKKY